MHPCHFMHFLNVCILIKDIYIYNNASLVTQYLTSFKIMLLNLKKNVNTLELV